MLLLDSEALSALAQGPPERRDIVRALLVVARREGRPVATCAAVLAEVVRGHPRDAAVHAVIRREAVLVKYVDRDVGVRAGRLLERAGFGSERAVDAFLVSTGDLAGGAVVATVDVGDISALGQFCSRIVTASIQP